MKELSRANTQPDGSRPCKRIRRNSCTDEVTRLNECGIYNMQSGREDEAEECFSQALGCADTDTGTDTAIIAPEYSQSAKSPYTEVSDLSISGVSTDFPLPSSAPDERMLYIYQRQKYDEGMYYFSNPLPLAGTKCEAVRSATLLYNVAQTHVRRGQYSEAQRWFHLSLVQATLDKSVSEDCIAQILVKIYHNLGHCNYRLGRNKEASTSFAEAHNLASKSNSDETVLAATDNCMAVLLFHSDATGANAALRLFKESLQVFRRCEGKAQQVGTILNNIGRVHYLNGDYDEALVAYKEALRIRSEIAEVDSIDVAATMCNTGQTLHQQGSIDMAMEYYEGFLQITEPRLGAYHRDIAIILKCKAEIHQAKGNHDQARKIYEKALKAGRIALGDCHPELASTINKLGNLHYEMQDLDTALRYYSEGLKIERAVLEPCHPHIMVTLMNIAQIHRHQCHFAAALVSYSEVHKLQVKADGPNNLAAASTLSSMGLMQYQLKSYSSAFDLYQEALRIQRDHYESDNNVEIASTLNSIGLVLFNQGVYGVAKSCFTDSLRIRRGLLGNDHRDVAILWYNIATIYLEMGEDDVAIELYKETLRVERSALGDSHHDVILTLQHLGLVHQQRGELEEALSYFGEALRVERAKIPAGNVAVAKLLNLIGNIHLQRANVGDMMKCYSEASKIYRSLDRREDALVIAGYNFYGLSMLHPPCASVA